MHAYETLTPDVILDALGALGLVLDGRLSALSSYENRVYLAMLDNGEGVVAKFYRPGRWSIEQIKEEHAFALELKQEEIPVVAPIEFNGATVHSTHELGIAGEVNFLFSVSPKKGGRAPELDDVEVISWLGRYLARIHSVGERTEFVGRERVDVQTMGTESQKLLMGLECIPAQFRDRWLQVCDIALEKVGHEMQEPYQYLRLHGDCHPGNILWTPLEMVDGGPHFVDLDDARMGPAVQDLWMLQSGDRRERGFQLSVLLDGYTSMREFDTRELKLIEPLRTLRLIHYSAWLAKRADDPSFVINFPWFWSPDYWQTQIDTLNDQIEAMDDPPLMG